MDLTNCTNVKNANSVTKTIQYSFNVRYLRTWTALFYRNVCDIRFILVPTPSYHWIKPVTRLVLSSKAKGISNYASLQRKTNAAHLTLTYVSRTALFVSLEVQSITQTAYRDFYMYHLRSWESHAVEPSIRLLGHECWWSYPTHSDLPLVWRHSSSPETMEQRALSCFGTETLFLQLNYVCGVSANTSYLKFPVTTFSVG